LYVLFKIKSALTGKKKTEEPAAETTTVVHASIGSSVPSIESPAFEKFVESDAFYKLLENEDQLKKVVESA
jgi:hypothetical protein